MVIHLHKDMLWVKMPVGQLMLEKKMPFDVDLLKIDVPSDAVRETPWELTRLARKSYYEPMRPERESWDQPALAGYREAGAPQDYPAGSDVHSLHVKRVVSVTPLSLDFTSRVDLEKLRDNCGENKDKYVVRMTSNHVL